MFCVCIYSESLEGGWNKETDAEKYIVEDLSPELAVNLLLDPEGTLRLALRGLQYIIL